MATTTKKAINNNDGNEQHRSELDYQMLLMD
jgi:hypothetical protein